MRSTGSILNVRWLSRDIDDMDGLPCFDDAAERGLSPRSLRSALPEFGKFRRYTKHCSHAPRAILESKQDPKIGFADIAPRSTEGRGTQAPARLAKS
jgi:hypothetical protein